MPNSHIHLPVTLLISVVLSFIHQPTASAHLMPSQHGTLSIVDGAAFMVLSLPMSAFEGIDDDGDGEVSLAEFNAHRGAIIETVRQKITLGDGRGNAALHGVMLSPVTPHGPGQAGIAELTIMGRFTLNDPAGALRFHVGLYGRQTSEQSLEISATHRGDNRKTRVELTPAHPVAVIFAEHP